ncbi:MAG TPA: nuclear transport factor 2 family protein [Gammaproteobacteria bacterium]|nr:nuclear transport factor 2 family protein [Gammaproteobacteria bacterium]
MANAEHNEELVRNFFSVLSTGDLENIRATLHPEASWTPMVKDVPGAGVHEPRDVIVDEFLAPVRGIFEVGDPKTTVNNIFCKGDVVCAETRATGKLRNGNTYDNLYCWVIEVRDDLIFAIREYMDSQYVNSVV